MASAGAGCCGGYGGPELQGSFRPEYSNVYGQQVLCLGKKSLYFYESHLQHPEKKNKVS